MRKKQDLAEAKSQLSKLLATENITIRHRPTKVGSSFNLGTRTLELPVWKDMNGDLYDMLIGHEISHALHTPPEGWHDALTNDPKRPKLKSFINVVEDARIEKLIKRKYPGIRKPFSEAYKEINKRDHFKIREKFNGDCSKLNLIDRINMYMKVGAALNIQFTPEERKFVDRVEDVETWKEVVQLARDIYDFQKDPPKQKKPDDKKDDQEEKKNKDGKNKGKPKKDKNGKSGKDEKDDQDGDKEKSDKGDKEEKKPKNDKGDESDSEDGDEEGQESEGEEEGEGSSDGDDEEDGDGEGQDDSDAGGKGDQDGEDQDQSSTSASNGAGDQTEPASFTDDAFRQEEEKLINHFGEGQMYFDMPEADLKKLIIPNKLVVSKYEAGIMQELMRSGNPARSIPGMEYAPMALRLNAAFHRRNKGYINMLTQEFELRKNARQYARQMQAKTGELDFKKLSRYKLTDDLFRKITTVSKGKSHGMIMFIDLSGSMQGTIREIFEQMLILCTFCKKVGIPFDVYGFGDAHSYQWGGFQGFKQVNRGFTFSQYDSHGFCLRHILSSELKGNAYRRAFTMVNVLGQISNPNERDAGSNAAFNKPDYCVGNLNAMGFELGGTPFLQTIVSSKYIIEAFKLKHQVDITNVIYLTDGDGSQNVQLGPEYNQLGYDEQRRTTIGFSDYKSKQMILTEPGAVPYQTALTKLVRNITGCRHIGYYFTSARDAIDRVSKNPAESKNMLRHQKFIADNGFLAVANLGYDNYYYIASEQMARGYRGTLQVTANQTKEQMAEAFNYHQQKKQNSKLIAKQFAQDVAE
jgi:hypothetical protein